MDCFEYNVFFGWFFFTKRYIVMVTVKCQNYISTIVDPSFYTDHDDIIKESLIQ